MTDYEMLLIEADNENIDIFESHYFNSDRIKGLYFDGSIALSSKLNTYAERNSILLEELGHHYTSSGNILDQSKTANRKQEYKARLWAYNKSIGLMGIVDSFMHGCKNSYEMAEFLEVTEEFLIDALECYKSKYGLYTTIDNYMIYFEPLGVLELYK